MAQKKSDCRYRNQSGGVISCCHLHGRCELDKKFRCETYKSKGGESNGNNLQNYA